MVHQPGAPHGLHLPRRQPQPRGGARRRQLGDVSSPNAGSASITAARRPGPPHRRSSPSSSLRAARAEELRAGGRGDRTACTPAAGRTPSPPRPRPSLNRDVHLAMARDHELEPESKPMQRGWPAPSILIDAAAPRARMPWRYFTALSADVVPEPPGLLVRIRVRQPTLTSRAGEVDRGAEVGGRGRAARRGGARSGSAGARAPSAGRSRGRCPGRARRGARRGGCGRGAGRPWRASGARCRWTRTLASREKARGPVQNTSLGIVGSSDSPRSHPPIAADSLGIHGFDVPLPMVEIPDGVSWSNIDG